jgi:hypothetical protein
MHHDEIVRKTEYYFCKFENTSGWHLSLEARAELQEQISTISFDRLGVVNLDSDLDRDVAQKFAISRLRLFLRKLADDVNELDAPELNNTRIISKGKILKWLREWRRHAADGDWCYCWPVSR